MGNAVFISVLSFYSDEFGWVPVGKHMTFSLHLLIHGKGVRAALAISCFSF